MSRVIVFIGVVFLASCFAQDPPLPKPKQFPRVDFPEREYQLFGDSECSFHFSYPTYAKIEKKTSFFNSAPIHPCWFDVYFPQFNGRLHCSYIGIAGRTEFDDLVDDAFELVSNHHIKANYKRESLIEGDNKHGLLFDIEGPVASPLLFYLTDSTNHFLLASLYFNNKVRPDSMQIIHDFVREDVVELIESFEWASATLSHPQLSR